MRLSSRVLLFLGLSAAPAPRLASQECAALASERSALVAAYLSGLDRHMADRERNAAATQDASDRLIALEGTAGHPDLVDGLMKLEDFGAAGMRRFLEMNQLPSTLMATIKAARPAEFWRGAVAELKRQARDRDDQYMREVDRNAARVGQIADRQAQLGCELAQPPVGPLPVRKNSAGLPIITDELLTRWFRGYRAMQNGGAYWQAAQLGQQDFAELNQRVGSYTIAACKPEGAARADGAREWLCRTDPVRATLQAGFTAEELGVFDARRSDMEAALSGNWSAVRM